MTAFNFPDAPTVGQVYQYYTWDGEKWISTIGGIGPVSAEAKQFLDRASGLSSLYYNAYVALIDGLVLDGVWPKLDVLRIYAAPDITTAALNLVSSNYTATVNGAVTFTAGVGVSGVNGSATIHINSNFNPATAVAPKYAQNSCHLSVYTTTYTIADAPIGHLKTAAPASVAYLIPIFSPSTPYFRMQTDNVGDAGTSQTFRNDFWLGNRSGASSVQGYKGATSIMTSSRVSTPVNSLDFAELGTNSNGTFGGTALPISQTSIGGSLTSTEVVSFYNRLMTFFTSTHPIAAITDIPNLKGWWDVSSTSSLTLSGSDVNAIADLSGNGNTLTGATSNKPVYNATGLNSRPTMMFSAGSGRRQRVVKTSFPFGTGNVLTFFMVGYLTNIATAYGRAFSYWAAGANDYDNNGSCAFARQASTAALRVERNGSSFPAAVTYSVPVRLIATISAAGTCHTYINGDTTSFAGPVASFINNGTFSLGASESATSTGEWDGAIAEAGIAATYLDVFQVFSLDRFLKNKWGL